MEKRFKRILSNSVGDSLVDERDSSVVTLPRDAKLSSFSQVPPRPRLALQSKHFHSKILPPPY